jgi:SsrA-binding protein
MKILAKNKKATFDYEIKETLEAGIVLTGQEVKSIKNGWASLKGAYVVPRTDGSIHLINAFVPPYQPANAPANYQADRSRQLLLTRKEITSLTNQTKERGLTLVPLKLYTKKGKIKLEIALARGKKKFDKREKIKRKEIDQKIRRALKNWGR